jgi:hypothetical protein
MQTLYSGDGYICAYDSAGTLYCWGQASGTPTIVTVATPFVSPQSSQGIPSGPIAHLSSQGGGYGVAPSALRYITTSGVLVDGYPVVTQICP